MLAVAYRNMHPISRNPGDDLLLGLFAPMHSILGAGYLTSLHGDGVDFIGPPLNELAPHVVGRTLKIQIGRTFHLDQIYGSTSRDGGEHGPEAKSSCRDSLS